MQEVLPQAADSPRQPDAAGDHGAVQVHEGRGAGGEREGGPDPEERTQRRLGTPHGGAEEEDAQETPRQAQDKGWVHLRGSRTGGFDTFDGDFMWKAGSLRK